MATPATRQAEAFAALLRYHRHRQNLTGSQLEKKAKLPPSHISQIETGSRPCGVKLALRLSTALGLKDQEQRRFLLAAAMTTQAPLYEALLASLIAKGFTDPLVNLLSGDQMKRSPKDAVDFVFQMRNGQVWASKLELTQQK
jgi:transcriptional regulator with XRE-family HTH domain